MSEWRLAWRLARRELDLRFRGLRLLLACLFLGVGALAAIGSLTQSIDGELAARGSAILGGDVEFGTSQRAATPDERAAMARLGTVSETVRMQATAIRGTNSVPVQLKGVDAVYPLYGTLAVQGGSATTVRDASAIWLVPALAQRLGIGRGATVRLGVAEFTVAGVIASEPDRLGEGFTLGPVAIVSMAGIARTGLVQPGSLYETKYRVRLSPGASPTAAVDRFKAAFPTGGWETKTRDRAAPGAERFVDRMGQFLLLVGLSALVIAGIGVGNGVSSYLAARRSSIAALKVLGATSGLIAKIYLLEVAVVAAMGIVAGLVAGAATVPLIVWLAGDVLPVAPSFSLQFGPLALAAAYGMLIALAFTAPPLIEAGSIPAAGLLRGVFGDRPVPLRRTLPSVVGAGAAIAGAARAAADAGVGVEAPVGDDEGRVVPVDGDLALLGGPVAAVPQRRVQRHGLGARVGQVGVALEGPDEDVVDLEEDVLRVPDDGVGVVVGGGVEPEVELVLLLAVPVGPHVGVEHHRLAARVAHELHVDLVAPVVGAGGELRLAVGESANDRARCFVWSLILLSWETRK